MDIKRINAAIDYIEGRLEAKVDFDQIEQIAQMSRYNFQKVFSILSGMSLGEYIRKRRMSKAMYLLKESDLKIIDIAFECGYETAESFTNAFKKNFNVTPTDFKVSDMPITHFPQMKMSVTIRGGISMTYQVKDLAETKVVGVIREYDTMEEAQANINRFWNELNGTDEEEALLKLSNGKIAGMLGVCLPKGNSMDYMIAVTSDETPEDFDRVTISAGKYLVFEAKGPVPDEIQRVTREAFETVIPSSDYALRDAPEFELYPAGNPMADNYVTEIWIPVQ